MSSQPKRSSQERFKVYVIGDGNAQRSVDVISRVEDIQSLVLNNLIQSTLVLSNSQMKTCQSFQSFSLYSRYKSEVLLQAFMNCKKRGLVNRRRANKVLGPKKSRAVPFVPMSYQLSQQYYRYFTWRFPSTLCNEVYDLLEILRQKGGMDRPNSFSFQEDDENTDGNGQQNQEKGDRKGQKEKDQGPTAAGQDTPVDLLVPPAGVKDTLVDPLVPAGVVKDTPVDSLVPSGGVKDTPVDPLVPPAGVKDTPVDPLVPPAGVKDTPVDSLVPPGVVKDTPVDPLVPPAGVKDTPVDPLAPSGGVKDTPVDPLVPPGVVKDTPVDSLVPPGVGEGSVLENLLPPVDMEDAAEDPLVPPVDLEAMLAFPIDAPGGSSLCCLTLMTLGLLSVDVSIPQQVVVVDSTLVDNDVVKSITKELDEDEEDEGDEEKKGRVEVKARQASHTNYLLMRGYFVPGIISLRNINSCEHIAVNSCTVRIRLRHTPAHTLFTESDGALSVVTGSFVPSLPAQVCRVFKKRTRTGPGVCDQRFEEKCVCVLGYSDADVEVALALRAAVLKEAEFGVDRQELSRRFSHLEQVEQNRSRNLQQYIQDLIDAEELLEVGALSPRLVSAECGGPWLLQCPLQVCEELCQALAIPESVKRKLALPRPQPGIPGPPPAKRPARGPVATMATASTESTVQDTVTSGAVTHGTVTTETVDATPKIVAVETFPEPASETIAMESVVTETVPAVATEKIDAKPKMVAVETSVEPAPEKMNAMESVITENVPPVATETTAAADTVAPETLTMETESKEGEVGGAKSPPEMSTSDKTELGKSDGDVENVEGSQEEEAWKFVARPWRIVDGSLNRPVCKGMLEALLLHIMTSPGLPEPALLQHYSGVLQPVVILDLLQVLVEIGCLRKRFTVIRSRSSLFSQVRCAEVSEEGGVSVMNQAEAFYEPTVDASLRLAQLFPHETNWNKWVQLCVR